MFAKSGRARQEESSATPAAHLTPLVPLLYYICIRNTHTSSATIVVLYRVIVIKHAHTFAMYYFHSVKN